MDPDLPTYEGSHVFIFDHERPTPESRIVLAYNPFFSDLGDYYATPGFGQRKDLSFEDAAMRYVKMQTGLVVTDLEPIGKFKDQAELYLEPNGVWQKVIVHNYRGWVQDPEAIEHAIEHYRNTDNGLRYKPTAVRVGELYDFPGSAPETIYILHKHFGLGPRGI